MIMRGGLIFAGCAVLTGLGATVQASFVMNDATTNWTAVSYAPAHPDWYGDQQTGISDSDIVGTNNLPALYYRFDAGAPGILTDGQLAFRLRLGSGSGTFPKVAHVGIDADGNGSVDAFISVDNAGNPDNIRIFDPGAGLNVSPNTTSIDSHSPYASYAEVSSNFNYSAVTATNDPGAFSYDADADGNTDFFLSWCVPFLDLVDFLTTQGVAADENSALTLIAATSTQPNSLNEDLNGPPKTYSGTSTWSQLGAASVPYSANGVVPEPTSLLLSLSGLALITLCRRGRRS
jgi:hypothetical protein